MPINKYNNRAIGVFDSGMGGLTVVKALKRFLPQEDVVYFGDTARVPYGIKSRASIIRFSKENTEILLKRKVKLIVVACNSSSSHALNTLKRTYRVPIVGVIKPGVQRAVAVTRNDRIGVIATPATILSREYTKQIKAQKRSIKVISQACPLFVPLVEEGWINKKVTRLIAGEYLAAIKKSKADTVILGCTHYPLLKSLLQTQVGARVQLIDSAKEVALTVKSLLQSQELHSRKKRGSHQFLVSDEPKHFQQLAKRFLGYNIRHVRKVQTF